MNYRVAFEIDVDEDCPKRACEQQFSFWLERLRTLGFGKQTW